MTTTTKTLKTIDELRAIYPYIPAYSFYMKSFDYWTVDQLRQAEAMGAPTDTYRVDGETYFTLSVIENPELVAELMRYVDEERTKEYFMLHLGRLTKGEGHKQKIKLTHLQTETHWLSLDEVTVPLLIKWLKKEYLSKK